MTETKKLTFEEWESKGIELFGEDKMQWRFVCPACHHVASTQDYKDAGAPEGAVGVSCIGRWTKPVRRAFSLDDVGDPEGHPCDYAGYGLFRLNPVRITRENVEYHYFDFAEEKNHAE